MTISKTLLGLALLCFMAAVANCQSENVARKLLSAPKCQAVYQYDYYGNDIKRIEHVHSWHYCCKLCKDTHGCKGYTWRKDYKQCWLKYKLENYQYCPHCYTQAFPVHEPKCEAIAHYDYYGGDIKKVEHVYSWKECCDICKKTHGCKGYTWRKDFGHCWLKHTLGNLKYCDYCYTQKY